MHPTWQELIAGQLRRPDVIGLQNAIDQLVDDSKSAFKLLLPDLSGSRVLYIGCDIDDTSRNLAASCESVTALFVTELSYTIQCQKASLRGGDANLEYQYINQMLLPFADGSFDGVVLDNALESIDLLSVGNQGDRGVQGYHPAFLREIKRVAKPNAWIFLKCRNLLSRESLRDSFRRWKPVLTGAFHRDPNRLLKQGTRSTQLRTIAGYRQLLSNIGFANQRLFGFDQLNQSLDRIIELAKPGQAHHFTKDGKLRFLPLWLYRLTMPSLGILAGGNSLPPSKLDVIISRVMTDLAAGKEYSVHSVEVNRKGKFVAMLDVQRHKPQRLMLKIPLTELAGRHIAHNFAGLKNIQQAMDAEKSDGMRLAFPKPVCAGCVQGTQYYVETCIPGSPFRKSESAEYMSGMVAQIEAALVALRALPLRGDAIKNPTDLQGQIGMIREYICQNNPAVLEKFDRVTAPILQGEAAKNIGLYFYKSDFSVNNTFVEHGAVTGVIDLDFWGGTHNKLVDYADFVFSFLRTFYRHSYADALAVINGPNPFDIGPFLNVEKTISELGGDVEEFKCASRIAWINSVSHILEFERTRLNAKRMDLVLFDPINSLEKLDPLH